MEHADKVSILEDTVLHVQKKDAALDEPDCHASVIRATGRHAKS
jgi:hypothetical protein